MSDREPFRTTIKVRHYELDTLGHLNHAVYHSYGEVSRLELLSAAGMPDPETGGAAIVLLESHISFRREIRGGETVEVSCDTKFGTGKTFLMNSNIYKADNVLAAEISCTVGLMDLAIRRLIADPRDWLSRQGVDLNALSAAE